MNPQTWYDHFQSYDYQGHAIAFRRDGLAGSRRLVLIHGFPTASWDWHKVWPALAAQFDLLTLDLIGFGWSAKPRDYDYSIVDQANLITALVDHLDLGPATIIAHDYGDSVAQELLARSDANARWNGCVMLNGGILPDHHRPRPLQKLLATPFGPLVARLITKKRFNKAFGEIFGPDTQPTVDELSACWAVIEHNDGRLIMPKLIRYMAERRTHRERWLQVLRNPPVPMTLINGLLDPVSGQQMVDGLRALNPEIPIVEMATIGHYPQLEAANSVGGAIEGFMYR